MKRLMILMMFVGLLGSLMLTAGPARAGSAPASAPALGCGFFCPTPTPAPAQAPIIRHPTWSGDKLFMDAAGSYIQTGATLLVNRSPYPVQAYTLRFDQSGTLFQAGGVNNPGTPGNYLLSNLVPAGIPCTLQVRNPNGMVSAIVNFQH